MIAMVIDAMEVPKWFDNPDAPMPCPCGRPPFGQMMLCETETGAIIMIHAMCAEQAGLGDLDGP